MPGMLESRSKALTGASLSISGDFKVETATVASCLFVCWNPPVTTTSSSVSVLRLDSLTLGAPVLPALPFSTCASRRSPPIDDDARLHQLPTLLVVRVVTADTLMGSTLTVSSSIYL